MNRTLIATLLLSDALTIAAQQTPSDPPAARKVVTIGIAGQSEAAVPFSVAPGILKSLQAAADNADEAVRVARRNHLAVSWQERDGRVVSYFIRDPKTGRCIMMQTAPRP